MSAERGQVKCVRTDRSELLFSGGPPAHSVLPALGTKASTLGRSLKWDSEDPTGLRPSVSGGSWYLGTCSFVHSLSGGERNAETTTPVTARAPARSERSLGGGAGAVDEPAGRRARLPGPGAPVIGQLPRLSRRGRQVNEGGACRCAELGGRAVGSSWKVRPVKRICAAAFVGLGEDSGRPRRSPLGGGSGQGTPLSVGLPRTARPGLLLSPARREPELDDRPSLGSSVEQGGAARRQLPPLPGIGLSPRVVQLGGLGARLLRRCRGGELGLRQAGAALAAAVVTLFAGGHGRGRSLFPTPRSRRPVQQLVPVISAGWSGSGRGRREPPCLGSSLAGEPKFFRWKWKLFCCGVPLHSVRWERSDFPNPLGSQVGIVVSVSVLESTRFWFRCSLGCIRYKCEPQFPLLKKRV